KDVSLGQQALVGALVVQVGLHFFSTKNVFQTLQPLVGKNADFVGEVLLQLLNLHPFNGFRALVLLLAFAGEDFYVHNDAFNSRRAVERSVANVPGLFTKDGTQQLLFRRQLSFTFRRNFADQNVALLDGSPNANDARFIQIAQHGFADIGNVARHFFRTELRVAGFDLVLLNVQGGVVVLFYKLFGNKNR